MLPLISTHTHTHTHSASFSLIRTLGYFVQGIRLLLWFAACTSLALYAFIDHQPVDLLNGVCSLLVIVASACVSIGHDVRTWWLMRRVLADYTHARVDVIRNGELKRLSVDELVVGDLVCVAAGERVPADVRLTQCNEMCSIDASTLNGQCHEYRATVEAIRLPNTK